MTKAKKIKILKRVLTPEVCDAIDLTIEDGACPSVEKWIEEDLDVVLAKLKEENFI